MVLQCFGNLYENSSLLALHGCQMPMELFCISCSRCWVNKCGLCDLCSSPPRCLNDSEAPLHVCVCVCQFNDGREEGKFILVLLLPLLSFQHPKFQKGSSSAVSQTEHLQKGNARGTQLPAHYTPLSIEQRRSHSHNVFCITGNFRKFPVINLANSIFCGLINLAS